MSPLRRLLRDERDLPVVSITSQTSVLQMEGRVAAFPVAAPGARRAPSGSSPSHLLACRFVQIGGVLIHGEPAFTEIGAR